jgi:hypothetical protein
MSREEIQKLLGGYATDTLSEAERRALYDAALEDQELFDELAKEQALREVLQDPSARQQLIEALGPARAWRWLRRWMRRPAVLAMAGGLAALLVVGGLVLRPAKQAPRREAIVADALSPSAAPLDTQLQKVQPSAIARNPRRLAKLAAKSPASPVLPSPPSVQSAPAPAPPPPPAVALARGAVASGFAPMAPMPKAKAAAVAGRLAVAYTLLLKGSDGEYSPVPSATVFHAGDSVRLQVDANEAGYIYLFRRKAGTGWSLVESQPVEKDQRCVLPSTGGLRSDTPATLELLLARASAEHVDGDTLASQAQPSSRITIEFR